MSRTKAFYDLSLLALSPPNTHCTNPTKPIIQYAISVGATMRRCIMYFGSALDGSTSAMNTFLDIFFRLRCNFQAALCAQAYSFLQNNNHSISFDNTKTRPYLDVGHNIRMLMRRRCTK